MHKINKEEKFWIPYNKGGEFRKWYGNQDYVVNWKNGPEDKTRGKKTFQEYYLKEYVSWSYIAMSTLACRYYPPGFLWDVAGSGIFDKSGHLYYLQAFIASKVGISILNIINPTINYQVENILQLPVIESEFKDKVDELVKLNILGAKNDWDAFETSWDFKRHPLIKEVSIKMAYKMWEDDCVTRFNQLKFNEEELNRIFIGIYDLQDELTPEVEDKDVTIKRADQKRDIKSLISYVVGCMLGRYSLDIEGLVYAGGDWDDSKYSKFIPDKDNCIPITDEEYFKDDILTRFIEFVRGVYGPETLEENLDFIAYALEGKGNSSREIIRNYFVKDFYKDHVKTYQKRPIYWLYDSGKQDGFKALIYMHRYTADTTGIVRVDYLHTLQKNYVTEIENFKDFAAKTDNAREAAQAQKRIDKIKKQLNETEGYDEKLGHLALSRISIDLDDGVKVNYEKVQTDAEGHKYEILAKI